MNSRIKKVIALTISATALLLLATALLMHLSADDTNHKETTDMVDTVVHQQNIREITDPQVAGTSDVAATELSDDPSTDTGISLRSVMIILGSITAAVLFVAALYFAMTRLLRK